MTTTKHGGSGADQLPGSSDNDRIFGNGGADDLFGDAANDELRGGSGADHLYGGSGKDALHGGTGGDWLYGESGDDVLIGGLGPDRLFGGSGGDLFVFRHADDSTPKHPDRIFDFSHDDGDRIDLSQMLATGARWHGSAPFAGHPGDVRFSHGLLSVDLDGDRHADFAVKVEGVHQSDLIL